MKNDLSRCVTHHASGQGGGHPRTPRKRDIEPRLMTSPPGGLPACCLGAAVSPPVSVAQEGRHAGQDWGGDVDVKDRRNPPNLTIVTSHDRSLPSPPAPDLAAATTCPAFFVISSGGSAASSLSALDQTDFRGCVDVDDVSLARLLPKFCDEADSITVKD